MRSLDPAASLLPVVALAATSMTPEGVPASRGEGRHAIVRFSERIAAEALRVDALADTLKGAKKFIEQAAREYAERFLFELLQNAYDAHPRSARGFVHILLDLSEG